MRYLSILLVLFALACSKKDDPTPGPGPIPPAPVDPTKPEPQKPPYTVVKDDKGVEHHTGLLHAPDEGENGKLGKVFMSLTADDCENLPAAFDLRDLNLVSPVRDQGQCGSCGYFSKIGSFESALRGVGKIFDLSEQEAVSCDTHNWGCEGSLLDDFDFQIRHGAGLESDMPYTSGQTGRNGSCKTIPVAAKGVSFMYVGAANRRATEKELKCALFKYKTVPWITADASTWGNAPSSEQTVRTSCASGQTNHAIGVTGWHTTASGKVAFHMRNSWGEGWGANGYMSLPLGCNNFGEEIAFIQVAQPPTPTPTPPGPTPTPDPCVPPAIKMPKIQIVESGTDYMIGQFPTAGWTYKWFADSVEIPGATESMYKANVTKEVVFKLVAKSSCGQAESQTKLVVNLARPVQ